MNRRRFISCIGCGCASAMVGCATERADRDEGPKPQLGEQVERTMKAQDALAAFRSFAVRRRKDIASLSPGEAVSLMSDFYSSVRAEDCDLGADGDMLLFQWGVYDWGDGEHFSYNITRQFIFPVTMEEEGEKWEEDSVWQLSLTLKFAPTQAMRELESGNRWCSTPDGVAELLRFVKDCKATELAEASDSPNVELGFHRQ